MNKFKALMAIPTAAFMISTATPMISQAEKTVPAKQDTMVQVDAARSTQSVEEKAKGFADRNDLPIIALLATGAGMSLYYGIRMRIIFNRIERERKLKERGIVRRIT